jgi:CheY-like chemotaxis protein
MDISLNGNKNGLELTRDIKKHPGYNNIPVICLTAHTRKADEKNAFSAGIDEFITKPVSNNTLRKVIEDYLSLEKN